MPIEVQVSETSEILNSAKQARLRNWNTAECLTQPSEFHAPIDRNALAHAIDDALLRQYAVLFSRIQPNRQAKAWHFADHAARWTHNDIETLVAPYTGMLSLKPGWDGEQAPKISRRTWNKAKDLLSVLLNAIRDQSMRPPELHATRGGDIDLMWTKEDSFLVITVPSESKDAYWVLGSRKGAKAHNWLDISDVDALILEYVSC